MLVRRGPSAYQKFVDALIETDQMTVIQHLDKIRTELGLPPSNSTHKNDLDNSKTLAETSSRVLPPSESITLTHNEEYR